MKAKRLLTHPRPHLDDIAGLWLIKCCLPGWRGAKISFVSAIKAPAADARTLSVGIGRGAFDEHKGDVGESAASLVWRAVRRKVRDAARRAALDDLVAWVRDEDQSLHDLEPPEWGPSAQIYYHYARHQASSKAATEFGFEILENALRGYVSRRRLERAWRRRIEFLTPWGRGAALATDEPGADQFAYRRGYALVVLIRPHQGYRQFRANPRSRVNFSAAYRTLLRVDARADWFLHHTKKLLLSGSDVAPGQRVTRKTLRELVGLVRRR